MPASPRAGTIDVWGDHNREASLVALLAAPDFDTQTLRVHAALPKILKTYGVTHVLSPFKQQGTALPLVGQTANAYVYRVDGAARARFVQAARHVTTDQETAKRLLDFSFDPDREILLADAPDSVHPTVDEIGDAAPGATAGRAVVTREDTRELVIDADAPANGFLLLADTFYPGWTATVDGTPTPIYRANHLGARHSAVEGASRRPLRLRPAGFHARAADHAGGAGDAAALAAERPPTRRGGRPEASRRPPGRSRRRIPARC